MYGGRFSTWNKRMFLKYIHTSLQISRGNPCWLPAYLLGTLGFKLDEVGGKLLRA